MCTIYIRICNFIPPLIRFWGLSDIFTYSHTHTRTCCCHRFKWHVFAAFNFNKLWNNIKSSIDCHVSDEHVPSPRIVCEITNWKTDWFVPDEKSSFTMNQNVDDNDDDEWFLKRVPFLWVNFFSLPNINATASIARWIDDFSNASHITKSDG